MAEALSDRDTVIREPIIAVYEGKDITPDDVTDQQFPFWRQDLTGFHNFRHLRLNLPLVTCFEQQISGKNLSGLVIPGIAGDG